ncbi:MAG: M50 family metallopeptidase [Phormidesmis sp.]
MAQFFPETQPTLGPNFFRKWILANGLAHGFGISLPILVANWQLANNYVNHGTLAFATFCLWVGLAQWTVLRHAIPISPRWILNVAIAPLASVALPLVLFPVSPFALLLLFITYPITLALLQWQLLRQLFQPAWEWIIITLIATFSGGIIGVIFGIISGTTLNFQPGLATLCSGVIYGVIYGAISYMGLRQVIRQKFVATEGRYKTGLDVPPTTSPWQITILPTMTLVIIGLAWTRFIPPLPTEALKNINPQWHPLYIFAPLVYLFASILIHEMGHLLFALAKGFELQAFAVDRWVLVRGGNDRKQNWKILKTRKRYAGGFILPIPKSRHQFSQANLMMMILGGPAASFLLFCAGAIFLFFPTVVSSNFNSWLLVALSSISLHGAIFNILPLKLGYLRTDGRRLLDLAKNNLQGQRFFALYGINASLRQGIRPKELDPAFIEQVLAVPEPSSDHVAGLLLAYDAALDKGELEKAGHYLDQALDLHLHFPELFRGSLLLEGTYFEAHIRHQTDSARQWFEKITEKALIPPYALLRAEAALLLAEGDSAGAQTKAKQGLVSVQHDRFMKGKAIAEEDYLQDILQSIS